jgi:hypothetical protein
MQRLFYGVALIWAVHSAVAAFNSERSNLHGTRRILQAFGVVDGPSPTAKPNIPPIFAPITVPINARPVSIPAPPTTKPVAAPTATGFGGGGSVTIGDILPTTTPTAASSTAAPTSPSATNLEFPTSTPTTASGVVILDEPTLSTKNIPTYAPMSMVQNNPPVPASWLSFVVTYTSELYTVVKDPKNIQGILRTVHGDVRKSLSHLIKQQNVSIVIELLESELLGT